jgi:hypothetical protein
LISWLAFTAWRDAMMKSMLVVAAGAGQEEGGHRGGGVRGGGRGVSLAGAQLRGKKRDVGMGMPARAHAHAFSLAHNS